jgi:hypothetical protein
MATDNLAAGLIPGICEHWTNVVVSEIRSNKCPCVEVRLLAFTIEDVPFVVEVLAPFVEKKGFQAECWTSKNDSAVFLRARIRVPVE